MINKKRWVSLYVENEVGVLAKISGLFSGKSYNLQSLTVGVTEDPTVSRMTIGLISDDNTFEQIKKQLNRCVEVIKVIDFTEAATCMQEVMFIKINYCSLQDKEEVFRICQVFKLDVVDYRGEILLVECVKSEDENDEIVALFNRTFLNRIEVVRGGTVAIERA